MVDTTASPGVSTLAAYCLLCLAALLTNPSSAIIIKHSPCTESTILHGVVSSLGSHGPRLSSADKGVASEIVRKMEYLYLNGTGEEAATKRNRRTSFTLQMLKLVFQFPIKPNSNSAARSLLSYSIFGFLATRLSSPSSRNVSESIESLSDKTLETSSVFDS